MSISVIGRRVLAFAATVSAFGVVAGTAAAGPDRLIAVSTGSAAIGAGSSGAHDGVQAPEWRGPKRTATGLAIPGDAAGTRSIAARGSKGKAVKPGKKAKSNPVLLTDWEGLNHRDSRLAFGGNQFSGEPPDQGLCVGEGFVLETVNQALRVYDTDGNPLSGVVSLNEFYGYPPAIDRSTFTFGPFVFDVSCHFDPHTERWFHLAATIEQDPTTGAFLGPNHLDLAVSTTDSPLDPWTIYKIPAQNDGTEGTPDHDCAGGPCFGDFPHLGVDKHGVYITTNEFPFFEDGFTGAQIYALSKEALVSNPLSVPVWLFNTADDPVAPDQPGFTVWPALSADKQFAGHQGGTEYFVSSNAIFDDADADSEELILWALSNTKSLSSPTPSLELTKTILPVLRYGVPANSVQKAGPAPLRECLNDTAGSFFGTNCGAALFGLPPQSLPLGTLDTGDSRVLDVRYANGKLWAVLGTAAEVASEQRTGVAWYILDPKVGKKGVSAKMVMEGILAIPGASLSYPTIGITGSGRGVIGVTLVGESDFPSAAYAPLDAKVGAGPVSIAEAGNSPQDGFTEYPPIGGNRPRWGDYGAAAVDGKLVYIANEYIKQAPCTLADYIATGLSCSGERTSFANWSTRVSKLKP